jgi:Ca2+-binding EF-hand superfamily protein
MCFKPIRIAPVAALALFVVGCVTTEEESVAVVVEHLGMEPEFTEADGDKSGHLTKEEVVAHQHADLLAQYDLDRDSHISEAEWRSAHPSASELDPDFNLIDRDKDQKISKAEAIKWVSEHVSFTKSFAKYDMDGDSRLYWKEVDAKAPTELRVTMFSLAI